MRYQQQSGGILVYAASSLWHVSGCAVRAAFDENNSAPVPASAFADRPIGFGRTHGLAAKSCLARSVGYGAIGNAFVRNFWRYVRRSPAARSRELCEVHKSAKRGSANDQNCRRIQLLCESERRYHWKEDPILRGRLVLKYATGTTWCGERELFGTSTETERADRVFEFDDKHEYTIELIARRNGNLPKRRISRDDFNSDG
jgi:hypothetical protein